MYMCNYNKLFSRGLTS